MSNKFWAVVWLAVLLFVWYDGVKHGYRMATEDVAAKFEDIVRETFPARQL